MNESDGSVTLELAILEGEIADGVEFMVNFFTRDGSAVGKSIYLLLTMNWCVT